MAISLSNPWIHSLESNEWILDLAWEDLRIPDQSFSNNVSGFVDEYSNKCISTFSAAVSYFIILKYRIPLELETVADAIILLAADSIYLLKHHLARFIV